MKSETLISLQSNFIVSSGFNRTQWCKIISSRIRSVIISEKAAIAEAETVSDIGSFVLLDSSGKKQLQARKYIVKVGSESSRAQKAAMN